MKQIFLILAVIFLLASLSCKKARNKSTTVIKDCTGMYLRLDEKDYRVCNIEKLSSYDDGVKVTATFKKIKKCSSVSEDEIICKLLHANEGWIEIDKIK